MESDLVTRFGILFPLVGLRGLFSQILFGEVPGLDADEGVPLERPELDGLLAADLAVVRLHEAVFFLFFERREFGGFLLPTVVVAGVRDAVFFGFARDILGQQVFADFDFALAEFVGTLGAAINAASEGRHTGRVFRDTITLGTVLGYGFHSVSPPVDPRIFFVVPYGLSAPRATVAIGFVAPVFVRVAFGRRFLPFGQIATFVAETNIRFRHVNSPF